MRTAILGSGFGIYGYLPAVVSGCGQRVVLPVRYQKVLERRQELIHLSDRVDWVRDESEAVSVATTLIVAQRPVDHIRWGQVFAENPHLERLLLEKPIAPTPDEASSLLEKIMASGKVFRIGYNFRLTSWASQLKAWLNSANSEDELTIVWKFQAYHYRHQMKNWKRSVSEGGGAIRFFGIHLIALLAESGYESVKSSKFISSSTDEAEAWNATFQKAGKPNVNIQLDTNSTDDLFCMDAHSSESTKNLKIRLKDPFDEETILEKFDRRASLLTKICQELMTTDVPIYPWYSKTNSLWSQVEFCSDSMSFGKL